MAAIVGTIFRKNGNVYYLDSSDILLAVGDKAICRLEEVIEIGEIVSVSSRISEDIVPSTTKKIIRKATYYDMSVDELNKAKEAEGYKKFEDLSKKYNLPMKLVDVHIIFDKSKMIFYFTSEKRVDFREMVKAVSYTHLIIICDRYVTSNMIYQAAKFDEEKDRENYLDWLTDLEFEKLRLPVPDIVIFLNISPQHCSHLIKNRMNKRCV